MAHKANIVFLETNAINTIHKGCSRRWAHPRNMTMQTSAGLLHLAVCHEHVVP